jgi:hypothetical protein
MQIIGTCLATGAVAARLARIVVIVIAAVLVAGSILTSIARPAPRTLVQHDAAVDDPDAITTTSEGGTLITLDETFVPVTPSPSPIAGPVLGAEELAWNPATGAWVEPAAIEPAAVGYADGGTVPVLVRITGAVSGAGYRIDLEYDDCDEAAGASFDRLVSPETSEAPPWLTSPGPGRTRPDSIIAAPAPHSAAEPAPILAWSATFSSEASGRAASEGCASGGLISLDLIARGDTVVLLFAGHLVDSDQGAALAPIAVGVERTN